MPIKKNPTVLYHGIEVDARIFKPLQEGATLRELAETTGMTDNSTYRLIQPLRKDIVWISEWYGCKPVYRLQPPKSKLARDTERPPGMTGAERQRAYMMRLRGER